MKTKKIAFIGAGSIGFTRTLLRDLLTVPELQSFEYAFTDIDADNLDKVHRLCARDVAANGLSTKVTTTLDRREALAGANYVFCTVRVGGLEAFRQDVEIPLRYGVDQCVGDTICAGGIMYAQRGIPVLLEFCRDIRELAAPGCLFFNYSNPMAMLTWACNEYGKQPTIGLCHGVQHSHRLIAQALGRPPEEVDYSVLGINHQTWFLEVKTGGVDRLPDILEAMERHPEISRREKVRIDMLRRFGYFSTESNGHLSEYLPWYRKRRDEIEQWIDRSNWIDGETGGYLRDCIEGRDSFEQDFQALLDAPPKRYIPQERSIEHGSFIIEALETGRIYRGHFNRINHGAITNLPADCVIEAPGYVDRTGIHTPVWGDLPLGCAAVCNASVSVQRLAKEAAVKGDDLLLRQAMLLDPLVGAVCSPPEVWNMVDDFLVEQEAYLPQYRAAIVAAKQRREDRGKPAPAASPAPELAAV